VSEKIIAIPTHIGPSVDKNGRERPAHISTRHRRVTVSDDEPVAGEDATPLDAFIAKHGGAEHLRKTLEDLTADQRAKLLDAMAHVDGTDAGAVMKKLGIHDPQASQDQAIIDKALEEFRAKLAAAKEAGIITDDEYSLVVGICEKEGLERAIEALQALRAPIAPPPEPVAMSAPETVAAAAEGAAGARASLQAQADAIFQKHADAANRANRANFEIEKRVIRGWKVTEQMRSDAVQLQGDAIRYLAEWEEFCKEHGLTEALS
jgi:hypothetical protein